MSSKLTTSQLVATMGVNVHVEYTDGKYASAPNVIADLAYLGETHVRDAVLNPGNQGQWNYDALAQAGIKFDMFFQGTDLSTSISLVDAFIQRHPGSVSLIEGPNEVNNFPIGYGGLTGNSAATAYQAALYAAVKADSQLKSIPVADLTSWPFLAGPSDDANYHFYPFNGQQPGIAYGADFLTNIGSLEPGKPAVMTEGGYNTMLNDAYFGGVDQATQAKLLLNLYLDNAKAGVQTTYVYQLLDAYADPSNSNSDSHFGLFNLDNSPKLAATAIHNLTSVLSNGADATATATDLAYTVSGLPAQGSVITLTKNSTTHDIVLWNEPSIWNQTTHSEVAASATNVSLHLAQPADVILYDPISSGQAVASYHGVQDISVAVTDHPIIVEVTSGQSSPSVTPPVNQPSPTPVTPQPSPPSSPTLSFSARDYLDANPDVKAAGIDAFTHYDNWGWKEGRDPSANFDTTLYLLHNPDVAAAGIDPLTHYMTYGIHEGRHAYSALGTNIASDGFDAEYYLLSNPDVAAAGMDPHEHYLQYGWKEGRNPNGWFDDSFYLKQNPDVAAAGMNPLLHYDIYGWKEGRDASASFDTNAYLSTYHDVASMHTNPLQYFLTQGAYNGHDAVSEPLHI